MFSALADFLVCSAVRRALFDIGSYSVAVKLHKERKCAENYNIMQ